MVEISLSGITSGSWSAATGDFSPKVGEKLLLSLEQLEKYADLVERWSGDFALVIPSDVDIKTLDHWLTHLGMIELTVEGFADGRIFTQARSLRDAGFKGEIRVAGPVIPDQAKFLARVGVDTVIVEGAGRAKAFETALQRFNLFYQTSADQQVPVSLLRHNAAEQRKAS